MRAVPLAVAVATLSACSAGASRPAAGGPAAVDIRDYAYSPAALTVPPGTPVTWVERDADIEGVGAHSVVADDGSFASAAHLATGAAFTVTLTAPGTYAYHCGIHNYMTGAITVR
ncbi:MAG: hypothetical protein QOE45_2045 [Frankiaceae bacterium]|nr:hypothetical protein [Frankiaceae bacterium]